MIPTAKLSLLLNALLAFSVVSVSGAPVMRKREVPQEHSHEKFLTSVRTSLNKNNPDGIVDPVFGLLGNAAASQGLGKITDPDCLQQATADQAFTNAKAAGDVQGQVDALIYRALERNTGKVGLASVACTSIKAVNPEIAAISQHQDPASANAASVNKAITLELAKQIAAVGGDPQQALESGTFAPGNVNDATGKGNSCDDANDPVGCIFTQKLLVEDATAAEIDAAVKGVAASGAAKDVIATTTAAAAAETTTAAATATATDAAATGDVVTVTVTVTVTDGAAAATSTAAAAADTTTAAADAATTAAATTTAAADAAATSAASTSNLDFGSCSNPTIEFGAGFDGRKENSFRPANSADFNHGSALNIKVIADFICQQLNDKCKASAATITACQSGETAAIAKGAVGEAADVFNAALGFTTSFGSGASSAASTTAAAAAATTTQAAAATKTAAAAAATTTAAASSGSSSGNLQTFTAALGSITPPAVTKTGSAAQPFCVDGNSCFKDLQNALVRSCDVQHNKCANAANAAGQNKAFSVEDCGNQQTTCNQNATATAASA